MPRYTYAIAAMVCMSSIPAMAANSGMGKRAVVKPRAPSVRTLRRAEKSLRAVLSIMKIEETQEHVIEKLMRRAATDVSLATALVALQPITAPAILKDGKVVGWRGNKKNKGIGRAAAHTTVGLINFLVDSTTAADRRAAVALVRGAIRSGVPFQMGEVGMMLHRLPAVRERANREPEIAKALETLYHAARKNERAPNAYHIEAREVVVPALSIIGVWPGKRVPAEILNAPRTLAAQKDEDATYLFKTALSAFAEGEDAQHGAYRMDDAAQTARAWQSWVDRARSLQGK